MSPTPAGIGTHYRRYVTGSVLATLAGLVSFPVMTRLLDNTQYGIFGYYDTWVLMGVAIGKLGAQHAIQRFYPHGGDQSRLTAFSTNLFYLPLAISFLIWSLVAMALIVYDWGSGLRQSPVFWMVLIASPMMVFSSLVETVMRVTEQSRLVMLSRVTWRWLELALMLGAVIFLSHTAVAAYGGRLLAAALVIAFYIRWVRKRLQFARGSIHPPALKEGLVYGMPLVLNEMIAVALVTLDRLMIKGISGDFADVGIYSIGAALAMQVSTFTNLTVFEAFTPMANRLFVTEGPAAVRALKKRLLMPMTYAALGCASLVWCFGADVIIALSGHSKAESGPVFALAGVVNCLQPLLLVAGYGLLLEKRSTKVLALMCGTLVINGVLNYFWIPMFGVMGAVYATAVSSAAMAIAHCAWVPKDLLQLPDGRAVLTALAAAGTCVAVVMSTGLFGLAPGWPRLLMGSAALVAVYGSLVWLLDSRLRRLVTDWRNDRKKARPAAAG